MAFWGRQWRILSVIFVVVAVGSGILAIREYSKRPWVATAQVFVSVHPVAGATSTGAPVTSFEAESRQVALDYSQVLTSSQLANAIHRRLFVLAKSRICCPPAVSPSGIQGDISASASGRVVTITVATTNSGLSTRIATLAAGELQTYAATYVGRFEAQRTQALVISPASSSHGSTGHILLLFAIRALIGAMLALAVALAWDYFDDTLRSRLQLEDWLQSPVLADMARSTASMPPDRTA